MSVCLVQAMQAAGLVMGCVVLIQAKPQGSRRPIKQHPIVLSYCRLQFACAHEGRPGRRRPPNPRTRPAVPADGGGCMPMHVPNPGSLYLSLYLVLFIEPVRGCCLLASCPSSLDLRSRFHGRTPTSTHVLLNNNKTAPRTEFFCMDLLSPQMNPAFGPVTNCRSTWLHRALLLRGKKSSGCECGRQTGRAYGEHWFSTFPTNLANRCLYLSAPLHAHEHGASRTKHGVSSNN